MKNVLLLSILTNDMIYGNEEPGLLYILSYIRSKGHIADIRVYKQDEIKYDEIVGINPIIIGITTYSVNLDTVLEVSKNIKRVLPETEICLGGSGINYNPVHLIQQHRYIDFLIVGEGEIPFNHLLTSLLNKELNYTSIPGLIWRDGDHIKANEVAKQNVPINQLPWMARDLLQQEEYQVALISGSRGCTGRCSFCVTGNPKKYWRGRAPEDIVNEILYIKHTYGRDMFYFIDCSFDNPGESYERVDEITSLLIEKQANIHYMAFFRSDFHRGATPLLMSKLKRSGLYCSILGVEAANEESLKLYNKSATVYDHQSCIDLFRKYDICVEIGFIMFHPYVTTRSLRENVQFLYRNQMAFYFDYLATRYKLYPGCELTNKIIQDGICFDESNPHGYHFIHSSIQQLFDYLLSLSNRYLNEHNMNLAEIHTIYIMNEYQKRIKCSQPEQINLLIKYAPIVNDLLLDLNQRAYDWFSQLLNLVDSGWSDAEAKRITEYILPEQYLLQVFQTINKNRIRLFKHQKYEERNKKTI